METTHLHIHQAQAKRNNAREVCSEYQAKTLDFLTRAVEVFTECSA
jgi:hypothetical protein